MWVARSCVVSDRRPPFICPGIVALHYSRRATGAQLSLGPASEDPSRAMEGRTGLSDSSAGCVKPTRAHPDGRIHSLWRYSPRRWLAATALGLGCRLECACHYVIELLPHAVARLLVLLAYTVRMLLERADGPLQPMLKEVDSSSVVRAHGNACVDRKCICCLTIAPAVASVRRSQYWETVSCNAWLRWTCTHDARCSECSSNTPPRKLPQKSS